MCSARRASIVLGTATALAVAALVAVLHGHDLARGWHEDDFGFLRLGQHTLGELWRWDLGWFYRPVFLTWFWLLLRAVGHRPEAFHVSQLIVHGLNACLLGLLVFRVSGRPWAASVCALVFVLALRGNQAVWWVSAASVTLMSLFMLLTLLVWHTFLKRQQPVWYVLALVGSALALCAREEAVILAPAMALMESLVAAPRPWRRAAVQYLPLVVLTAVWLLLALRAHAAYVRSPADFMDYDARSYVEALSPGALPARLQWTVAVVHNAWHGALPLMPLSAVGLIGLGCVVASGWGDRRTLWFLAWLGLLALPGPLSLGFAATMGRFLYAPTLAGVASGVLLLTRLDPRRCWTGRALLVAVAALVAPNDLRLMREFYLSAVTDDPSGVIAFTDWVVFALALLSVVGLWRLGRTTGRQLALVSVVAAATIAGELWPEGERFWWLTGVLGCACFLPTSAWCRGALGVLALLPRAGTSLPLLVASLALWPVLGPGGDEAPASLFARGEGPSQ